jgi:archaeal cell division control protein 6
MFKDMLKHDETLFKDDIALDPDYIPKILKYRENEQQHFATLIKPLIQKRQGSNLFIYGSPGIGKTAACKHVLREMELETDQVKSVFINCWKFDTVYKILVEICNQIGYKWIQNKTGDKLLKDISEVLNKKASVIVLDEVDKLKEEQIIYQLLEELQKKCIFMITNEKDWIAKLDNRVKSRLLPEMLEFKPYNYDETKGILEERKNYAFFPNSWDNEAFEKIAEYCFEKEDIRTGITLLRNSTNNAEMKSSKLVKLQHVQEAISKIKGFEQAKIDLDSEDKEIIKILKETPELTALEIYKKYNLKFEKSIRTLRRKLDRLKEAKAIDSCDTPQGSKYSLN